MKNENSMNRGISLLVFYMIDFTKLEFYTKVNTFFYRKYQAVSTGKQKKIHNFIKKTTILKFPKFL